MACEKIIDILSADIESGLFDFDDASHLPALSPRRATERLQDSRRRTDLL
jgi:hypothetical protein